MSVQTVDEIRARLTADGRYHLAAYDFIHEVLALAVERVHGSRKEGESQHVTGQDLCHAMRDLALRRWGLMARAVLRSWGVRRTRDLGEMVYLLISIGVMGRQPSDRIEDFDDVFDFDALDRYECLAGGAEHEH
ncbi:MAG: hypothetical protein HRU75_07635 [Planctomycetia bacterium]|nr:MAG: hypothetical protein HRU75_07635 [Planctomycetia bacterium]